MLCNHYGWYCSSVETWELPGLGGKYQTLCTVCMLQGPVADSRDESLAAFWKINAEREIMSTEDYKRGVEDATKPYDKVTDADPSYLPLTLYQYAGEKVEDLFDSVLSNRRKKLLTKKVTKWTGVIKSNYSNKPCLLDLYDSKEDIEHYYTISPALCPPIKLELELPL